MKRSTLILGLIGPILSLAIMVGGLVLILSAPIPAAPIELPTVISLNIEEMKLLFEGASFPMTLPNGTEILVEFESPEGSDYPQGPVERETW